MMHGSKHFSKRLLSVKWNAITAFSMLIFYLQHKRIFTPGSVTPLPVSRNVMNALLPVCKEWPFKRLLVICAWLRNECSSWKAGFLWERPCISLLRNFAFSASYPWGYQEGFLFRSRCLSGCFAECVRKMGCALRKQTHLDIENAWHCWQAGPTCRAKSSCFSDRKPPRGLCLGGSLALLLQFLGIQSC